MHDTSQYKPIPVLRQPRVIVGPIQHHRARHTPDANQYDHEIKIVSDREEPSIRTRKARAWASPWLANTKSATNSRITEFWIG
mmetsp:Transcript_10611/g.21895  ORF Transcript_10611/g.21895 Transcript_10611/m.21895 type:complete len:83 (+) Transcript_10611:497-745(+)